MYMGERDHNPKLPITREVLARILASATHPTLSSKLNMEAAVTTAFASFLRCSEFTIQAGKAFDPSIHITRSCVQFMPSIASPSHVVITVPSSKTDPFRKGVAIMISSAPGTHTCAISPLKALFEFVEQLPESPLFLQDDDTPMSQGFFIS